MPGEFGCLCNLKNFSVQNISVVVKNLNHCRGCTLFFFLLLLLKHNIQFDNDHIVFKEFTEFRKERGNMLLSRKNQLLLEFSFWNEPVPREGPNIYELRSYQLRVSFSFLYFLSYMMSWNVQRVFVQRGWKTDIVLKTWFLSKLMAESVLLSKCGVQNEGRLQQDINVSCEGLEILCFNLRETPGKWLRTSIVSKLSNYRWL